MISVVTPAQVPLIGGAWADASVETRRDVVSDAGATGADDPVDDSGPPVAGL